MISEQPWKDVPRVLFVTSDQPDTCTVWRVWWPTIELYARGYVADDCRFGNFNLALPHLEYGRYTVVVTPRLAFTDEAVERDWLRHVDDFRARGICWLYDADDDLFSEGFAARYVVPYVREPVDVDTLRFSRQRLLSQVDGVTVASAELGHQIGAYTDAPVLVVPNGMYPTSFIQAVEQKPRSVPPLTIGWSGGPRLEADLEPMFEVWPKLAREYPELKFVVQGWCPPTLVNTMPPRQLIVIGGRGMADYPAELRNIDIFCCFAANDPWIKAKTPIKWWEATLGGAACVVSSTLYGPAVHPPHDALVASDPSSWLDCLRELIGNAELRHSVHENALVTVLQKHTMSETYADWLRAWRSICGH